MSMQRCAQQPCTLYTQCTKWSVHTDSIVSEYRETDTVIGWEVCVIVFVSLFFLFLHLIHSLSSPSASLTPSHFIFELSMHIHIFFHSNPWPNNHLRRTKHFGYLTVLLLIRLQTAHKYFMHIWTMPWAAQHQRKESVNCVGRFDYFFFFFGNGELCIRRKIRCANIIAIDRICYLIVPAGNSKISIQNR